MSEFAKGADLLVHEAMLIEALPTLMKRIGDTNGRLKQRLLRVHTPAAEAAKIAQKADVKCLALSHLIPSDDPDFTKNHWQTAVGGEFNGQIIVGARRAKDRSVAYGASRLPHP